MPRKDPRLNNPATSVNDRVADASIRHMLYLEGLKTRQSREVIKFINREVIPELKADLAVRLEKGMRGTVTNERIDALIKRFEKIADGFNIHNRVQSDMLQLAFYEMEFHQKLLEGEIPVKIDLVLPTAETVTSAVLSKPFDGKTMEQWFSGLSNGIKDRIHSEIRRGVVEGQTSQQIARRVNDSGIFDIARRHIDTVVRTAVNHTANTARDELFKANDDIVEKVRWTATLDSRTSDTCKALDGKTWPVGSKHPTPPAHPNCRSAIIAVTKSWRDMGIDIDELTPAERVSMNGKVPSDVTYGEWLRKQPASVQVDALGKTKAKLFHDGGLKVDRFVNRNGFELNLDDLRIREAGAFEKAGL